jgi:hypothetical protein
VIRGRITQAAIKLSKSSQFVSRICGAAEKLPQTIGGKVQVFDSVGDPDAEGSATASGSMPVTAKDTCRTNRFGPLMILIIATQETVPDEGSHNLAVRTGRQFEPGQQIVDIFPGRADPTTHD